MAVKHFLQFKDFTREELEYVFERTRWIKNQFKSRSIGRFRTVRW